MPHLPASLCAALRLAVVLCFILLWMPGQAHAAGGDIDSALRTMPPVARISRLTGQAKQYTAQTLPITEARAAYLAEKSMVQRLRLSRRSGFVAMGIGLVALASLAIIQRQRVRRIRDTAAIQLRLAQQQEQAATALLNAELTERRCIAAELHEGVAQILSAARMNLSGAQDGLSFADDRKAGTFHKAVALLEQGCAEIRTLSHQVMPEVLMRAGLPAALNALAGLADQSLLEVSVYVSPISEAAPMHTRLTIYRMAQEALSNTMKHARARHFDLQLSEVNGRLTLSMEDDGRGFDAASAAPGKGLQSLRQRAALLGGHAEVSSRPGMGTHITVTFPTRTCAPLPA